jgi:hypothetical protein
MGVGDYAELIVARIRAASLVAAGGARTGLDIGHDDRGILGPTVHCQHPCPARHDEANREDHKCTDRVEGGDRARPRPLQGGEEHLNEGQPEKGGGQLHLPRGETGDAGGHGDEDGEEEDHEAKASMERHIAFIEEHEADQEHLDDDAGDEGAGDGEMRSSGPLPGVRLAGSELRERLV